MKWWMYTIGRLRRDALTERLFDLGGTEEAALLPLFVIASAIKGAQRQSGVRCTVFYPETLPFAVAHSYENDDSALAEAVAEACQNPDSYLENPTTLFDHHPVSKLADTYDCLPGLGRHVVPGTGRVMTWNTEGPEIQWWITQAMLENWLSGDPEKDAILVDVSSGHHAYVVALLDSARYLAVCAHLFNGFAWSGGVAPGAPRESGARPHPVWVAVSARAATKHSQPNKIYVSPLEVKSFYWYPIDSLKVARDVAKAIFPGEREGPSKDRLAELLELGHTQYYAVTYGLPLFLASYPWPEIDHVDRVLLETVQRFAKHLRARFTRRLEKMLDSEVNEWRTLYRHFRAAVIALCMLRGTCLAMQRVQTRIADQSRGIRADELRQWFDKLSTRLRLPGGVGHFVRAEISLIKKSFRKAAIPEDAWILLAKFRNGKVRSEKDDSTQSLKLRNLLAHAGLERNIVEARGPSNDLRLRYVPGAIERVATALRGLRATPTTGPGSDQTAPSGCL